MEHSSIGPLSHCDPEAAVPASSARNPFSLELRYCVACGCSHVVEHDSVLVLCDRCAQRDFEAFLQEIADPPEEIRRVHRATRHRARKALCLFAASVAIWFGAALGAAIL